MNSTRHLWVKCGDRECGLRFPVAAQLRTASPALECPRCAGDLGWPHGDHGSPAAPSSLVSAGPGAGAGGVAGTGHPGRGSDVAVSEGGGAVRTVAPTDAVDHEVVAVVDNVRSVRNVGAMLRTADAMGVAHLHLGGITPPGDHDQIDKTALGAQHAVAWSSHPDTVAIVTALQGQGWQIWALEDGPRAQSLAAASADLHSFARPAGIAMVVGHEVAGVDPAILAMADRRIVIPMRGTKDSLNVATAFGIAAYALTTTAPP